MIKNIQPSNRKDKRYMITYNDKDYHFGLKNGSTYIDHKDKLKRDNYRKRHYGNIKEKYLIDNLIISPSLLSWYLLWTGPNINENLKNLNKLLKK